MSSSSCSSDYETHTRDPLLQHEDSSSDHLDSSFRVKFLLHLAVRAFPSLVLFSALGGVYIGFNGIKPVMLAEGMFHNVCPSWVPLNETCPDQILRLNSIFQFSSGGVGVCGLIIGIMNDWLSQTLLFYISSIVNVFSFALFGALLHFRVFDEHFWWLSHATNFLMGLSGSGLFLTFLKWMFSVPRNDRDLSRASGFINSSFSASWNVGAAVFWFFNLIYFYVWKSIFLIVEIYCGIFLLWSLLLGLFLRFPKSLVERVTISNSTTSALLLSTSSCSEKFSIWIQFWRHACSWKFYVLFLWMSLSSLQLNFYVSTMYDQVVWLSKSEAIADSYSFIFSLMLALIGLGVCVPLGWLVEYQNISIVVLLSLNGIWTSLSLIETISVQYPLYAFVSIHRSFLYIVFFRLIGLNYGFVHFGVASSGLLALAGIVSFFSILMNRLVESVFQGSFFVGNAIAGGIGILGHLILLAIVVADWSKLLGEKKDESQESEDDEDEQKPMSLVTIRDESLTDDDDGDDRDDVVFVDEDGNEEILFPPLVVNSSRRDLALSMESLDGFG